MDKFGNYIRVIMEGVPISKTRRLELEEEIRDHLEMSKKDFIKNGYTQEEAEQAALVNFGSTEDINKSMKKVYTSYKKLIEFMAEKRILKESLHYAACLVLALFLSLSVRSYAFAATEVTQTSMQNTLFEGQKIIESKFAYYNTTPSRGDIVIINTKVENGFINAFVSTTAEFFEGFSSKESEDKNRLIKRVIGIPGDMIDIRDGNVYVNGEQYAEPYVHDITLPNSTVFPITIPDDEYFVMGDNREVSYDSRDFGLVNIKHIEGKAVLRIWPFDKFGDLDTLE